MSKTNKELTPLEALNIIIHQFSVDDFPLLEYTRIIEQALKQAQEDKEVLNIFKNALTIKHTCVLLKEQKSLDDTFVYAVRYLYEITQNNLDEKLRKSLREWVLENAFPKELKVLEIIKYKGLDVGVLQGCFERNETVKEYLRYSDDDCNCEEEQLTKEEYDLLKEVLL